MRRPRLVAVVLAVAALAAVVLVLALRAGDDGGRPAAREVEAQAPSRLTWLALSDLHFDPFAGSDGRLTNKLAAANPSQWPAILGQPGDPPSGYGHDTNYTLLRSTLDSLGAVKPAPQVAVVTGDFLAHDLQDQYEAYAKDESRAAYEAFVALNAVGV